MKSTEHNLLLLLSSSSSSSQRFSTYASMIANKESTNLNSSSSSSSSRKANIVDDFCEESILDRRSAALKEAYQQRWRHNFERVQESLQKVKRNNKNDNDYNDDDEVPLPDEEDLKKWLDVQRILFRKRHNGKSTWFSDEQLQKLQSLGYSFDPRNEHWESRYQQLCQFVTERKCFPYEMDIELLNEQERKLLYWCQKQRKQHRLLQKHEKEKKKKKQQQQVLILTDSQENQEDEDELEDEEDDEHDNFDLVQERETKLNQIGFTWNTKDATWEQRYHELEEYYKHHGDCLVPSDYAANPSLGNWVLHQRIRRRKGHLTSKRIDLLDRLDFAWNAIEVKWHLSYKELEDYVCINGLGRMPTFKQNKKLRDWAEYQKRLYPKWKNGEECSLTDKRKRLLDKLGFPWPEC